MASSQSQPLPGFSSKPQVEGLYGAFRGRATGYSTGALPYFRARKEDLIRGQGFMSTLVNAHSVLFPTFEGNEEATEDFQGEEETGLTWPHVSINLVKCAVGAGSFSLPFAFQSTGIWVGSIALVLFGILAAYTMNLLASAEKIAVSILVDEQERRGLVNPERRRMTYPEVASSLFNSGIASVIVTLCTVLTSVGVCVAYVLFIAVSHLFSRRGIQRLHASKCLNNVKTFTMDRQP